MLNAAIKRVQADACYVLQRIAAGLREEASATGPLSAKSRGCVYRELHPH
jgi:hypothetical protein